MSSVHRIRRQQWLGRAADQAGALALRAYLREHGEQRLDPALAAAFDAVDDGRDRHLARLEIRLTVSAPERLDEELAPALFAAVQAALARLPGQSAATATPPSARASLRRYLASGEVDWWLARLDDEALQRHLSDEAAIVLAEALAAPAAGGAWPALQAVLPADAAHWPDALFRLLQLLDAPAAVALLAAAARVLPELAAVTERLADDEAGAATPLVNADHRRRRLALRLALALAATPAHWQRALAGVAAHPAWALVGEPLAPAPASPTAPAVEPAAAPPAVPAPGVAAVAASAAAAELPAPGLPLRNAGLLLLHPWLPRLFAELGWVASPPPVGEPFPAARLASALALLHWLAEGREEAPEYALGGAKLLLGLDPDSPFPVGSGLLDAAAMDEGGALLRAAIEHWPALGRTSSDGLRTTFLQRGGLLYRQGEDWLLRMQLAAPDLLLDRLPWGIALIRLPWSRRLLHVDWGRP